MHSTKTQILALLKRSDGATVDDLSTSLGLASMTVRQHLTALERDGLLLSLEVRRRTGRPHYRYQLTADGHRHLSDGYDRLVLLLVQTVGNLDGRLTGAADSLDRQRLLFRAAAEDLAGRHRAEVAALPKASRIERVTTILREHGGFAEWHALEDGVELRDFGCVFREMVGRSGVCEWHETFLSRILDAELRAAPPPGDGCADRCGYIISIRAQAPAPNRGSR